ncbi:MAG: alanine--tRNA ligase [bacterium]
MNSRDIRTAFLEFFRSNGHAVVPSSPLIPRDDPTLLFTNAGMVQFKSVFTGEEQGPSSRAVTCQKCMRAGGKHNDIENVGHTARHHTFFEMLGNFSFGDYFKKEAIIYAWELLTVQYKLPVEKLWVSVYEKDDEAEALWLNNTGMPKERIVRLGEKDNFWQMGDTGPCGPCSEIIIDQGPAVGCGQAECRVGCDCDRFLEIWNLVFMQFSRDRSGALTPLPKPSIDTGMGLERVSAILQGKLNNFDSDLFSPIIAAISSETGISYKKSEATDISIRVIADHIRAITFLITEGIVPSNEGRGYVLRRVIRRASRHARLLGIESPVLFKFVESVIESLGDVYPEIIDERERTRKVLSIEEERFIRTLQQGVNRLDSIIEALKHRRVDTISGEDLFRLYDTFGFPLDLARDIALDSGLRIDEQGFHTAMERQRETARASWVTEETASTTVYRDILSAHGQTIFTGYDTLEGPANILAMVKAGSLITELKEGEEAEVILDRTPFYGESGGQAGDTGLIRSEKNKLIVTDTKKTATGIHLHIVKVVRGSFRSGMQVSCHVDEERRRAIMKNHTATHILQASLRNVLGEHVKQSGSLVSDERLRFDFTHFSGLTRNEIEEIENMVNGVILQDRTVKTEVLTIDDAIASGATALFDEKYGDTVRVVSVDGFSKELCGGTHCKGTGEIGNFLITGESSVASGIRRIEAVTGKASLQLFREKAGELALLNELLKTDKPVEKIKRILEDNKNLKKEIESLKTSVSSGKGPDIMSRVKELNGVKVLALRQDNLTSDELRTFADNVRGMIKSGIIVLASVSDGQASMLATVTKDLQERYHAGNILKQVASLCDGRGGGNQSMAQGGTKEIGKLDKAIEMVYDIVKKTI